MSESLSNGGTTLFGSTRTYDAVGNVATVNTTLSAGTDNQQFCYDEQNRLTWAGSTGTPPCTGTAITPGTLSSAAYTMGYSYDAMNRVKSNTQLGSYTYGTTPVHAAAGAGSNGQGGPYYSASYDAVGDMVCRAPNRLTTCSGTVTGQQLQYNAERQVSHWQSSPSSPTSSADYLYDGSGNRVEQVGTSGSTTTKVYYLFGGLEEVSASGSTSTLTKYYSAGGILIGVNVGGTISYLASDGLGSVSEALSSSGTVTAAQLYGPYGALRYASGTMPTAKGFTGQRADASTSGLDYYGARYYDPVLGQFASADTKEGPNRFAYVAGNPETLVDPTGHRRDCSEQDCNGGGSGGSGGSGGGHGCQSDGSCGCYTSCGGPPPGTPPGTPPPLGKKSPPATQPLAYKVPKNNPPLCDRICQAQQMAQDAVAHFAEVGVIATLISGILFALMGSPLAVVFGPVIMFLATALLVVASVAATLAVEFGREASEYNGWYTVNNVGGWSFNTVGATLASFLLASTAIGGALMTIPGLTSTIGAGIKVGGLSAVLGLGAFALSNIVSQENVLAEGQTGATTCYGRECREQA